MTDLHQPSLVQLTEFMTAGKYPVGVKDGDGFSAHNYFPDSVLAGIEEILPQLEDRLGEVATDRAKKPKTDLNRLCVDEAEVGS